MTDAKTEERQLEIRKSIAATARSNDQLLHTIDRDIAAAEKNLKQGDYGQVLAQGKE